jgi:hypothetical protein
MKATIEFDDALYRRLKIEAVKRGRTVRELVADGVLHVLNAPSTVTPSDPDADASTWRPSWLGSLSRYGRAVSDHTPAAVRESVARGRAREPRR